MGPKGNLPPCQARPTQRSSSATEVTRYENSPGTSIQTIATDLGINRATLANWVKKYGTGTRTTGLTAEKSPSTSVTEAERIRKLERENARLREERDILRKAAMYFAEETNW